MLLKTLSQSLEEIPRFAVPLLPVITVKSSGEERHIFSNARSNMRLPTPANKYCLEEQKWMSYVGVISDRVVVGRSLVMFVLETEGSLKKNNYDKRNHV